MKKEGKRAKVLLALMVSVTIMVVWSPQLLAQKKTIKVLGWAGPRCEFSSKGIADIYMKTYPDVKVVVDGYPYGEFLVKIALDIAGGGGAYDVVWAFTPFDKSYAEAGYLRSLDKYLLDDPEYWADFRKDTYPNVLSLYQHGDHWWAMAADSNTQLFYYRKDLLSQAGVKVPTTWDEVLKAAVKLHNPPDIYAIGNYLQRYWATDSWLALFYSAGGEFWTEDYQPLINSPAGLQATELLLELSKYNPPEALSWDEAKLHDALGNAGIVAMAPNNWAGPVLTDPKMSKFADQIDVAMVPRLNGNLVVPMGGLGLGVTTRSGYPDEAWRFIKSYLARENQRTVVSLGGQPARLSALTDPVNVAKNRFFPLLAESLKLAVLRPVEVEYERLAELLGVELDNVILGKKTPKQALDDVNKTAEEIFMETGRMKR